jgi:very-short-patch-repair endonuclease
MRLHPTVPEAVLWSALSAGKAGAVFRRQVPLAGRFIVDLFAPGARLIVEVDGRHHERRRRADARRDRVLAALGYRVLRLEAELVMRDLPEAVARVRAALPR